MELFYYFSYSKCLSQKMGITPIVMGYSISWSVIVCKIPVFYLRRLSGYFVLRLLLYKMTKSKKGHNSSTTRPTEKIKNTGSLIFHVHATYEI